MRLNSPLHIVSMGAATAVGGSASTTMAAVMAKIAYFTDHPYMINCEGGPYVVAMASYISADRQGIHRLGPLLDYAINDCLGAGPAKSSAFPLVLCLPEKRPGAASDLPQRIRQQTLTRYPQLTCAEEDMDTTGHAAAYAVINRINLHLQQGHEFCLLAAVDSYHDADTLEWLEKRRQLNSESCPNGFIAGEAAGALLICTQATLARYRLVSQGQILAFAVAEEPISSDKIIHKGEVCLGHGLTQAMQQAIQNAVTEHTMIDKVITDLNGEIHRTDEYGFALARIGHYLSAPDENLTPADSWGDIGAASGVLAMILAANYGQPNRWLLCASACGQRRSALVLHTPRTYLST